MRTFVWIRAKFVQSFFRPVPGRFPDPIPLRNDHANTASFHSNERITPSRSGIKHLKRFAFHLTQSEGEPRQARVGDSCVLLLAR